MLAKGRQSAVAQSWMERARDSSAAAPRIIPIGHSAGKRGLGILGFRQRVSNPKPKPPNSLNPTRIGDGGLPNKALRPSSLVKCPRLPCSTNSPILQAVWMLGDLHAAARALARKTATPRSCCPTRWAENLTTCQGAYTARPKHCLRTSSQTLNPDQTVARIVLHMLGAHTVFPRCAGDQCPRPSTPTFYTQLDKPGRKGIAECRLPFAASLPDRSPRRSCCWPPPLLRPHPRPKTR